MYIIKMLALSRIKYNKSNTILTMIAIILTTCLLMAIGTAGIGMVDMNKKIILKNGSNYHGMFSQVNENEILNLKNHMDVEALSYTEIFANVEKDKMNGVLQYTEDILKGINGLKLSDGNFPQNENEIAGPPGFFERLGYEQPKVGDTVSVSFRVYGEGEIITRNFIISGLLEQLSLENIKISDTRTAYAAIISKDLADSYLEGKERNYNAMIRVNGEDILNYDEMEQSIKNVATDIGLDEDAVFINTVYIMWMTDPGTEMMAGVIGIGAIVLLFSGLVIYSIYYVSVITNVQELGKLKALGASRKQMKKLLLREGFLLTLFSIPIGLILGYIIASLGLKMVFMNVSGSISTGNISDLSADMFSVHVVFSVIVVVFITVYISLTKPMKMVSKISPIEAIRYQEKGMSKKAFRNGYEMINISVLSHANISRNKKRTIITMVTLGVSSVLFMSIAGVMSSIDKTDFARRTIPKGDFRIQLYYSNNDKTYDENNLNTIQQQNLMGEKLLSEIEAIPGVTNVETEQTALSNIWHDAFEPDKRITIASFTRDDIELVQERLERGQLDYDKMVAENGILYSWDYSFEKQSLQIEEMIPFQLYDGQNTVDFKGKLMGSVSNWEGSFLMPKEVMDKFITHVNTTTEVIVYVENAHYADVKEALNNIVNESPYFYMVSLDEEINIAISSTKLIKYPTYLVLAIIGVIGFMNFINTMITSIVTRKRELGILQAIGLSNKQLVKMIQKEGFVFTFGILLCAVTVGNLMGYILFLWGKSAGFMSVTSYHYPIIETIVLMIAVTLGQMFITFFINENIHKESLIERIRQQE